MNFGTYYHMDLLDDLIAGPRRANRRVSCPRQRPRAELA